MTNLNYDYYTLIQQLVIIIICTNNNEEPYSLAFITIIGRRCRLSMKQPPRHQLLVSTTPELTHLLLRFDWHGIYSFVPAGFYFSWYAQ